MKARTYPRKIREFAALISDLEAGYDIRRKLHDSAGNSFALDANVVWFYLDSSPRENAQVGGYTAKVFGVGQVASLVRKAIEKYAQGTTQLYITKSHKYEADTAFVATLKTNYEKMREDLEVAFSRVFHKGKMEKDFSEDILARLVELLKDEFEDSFDLLLDVHLGRPSEKLNFDKRLKLLANHDTTQVPSELQKTLDKIALVLRDGDGRPSFSVAQDIRALRDLALHNARRNNDQIVLLSLDQKLINVVRLVQFFQEPWAQYITLENCQTIWLWSIGNTLGLGSGESQLLEDLIDDFRRKSSFILAPESLDNEKPFILYHKSVLANLCKSADRDKLKGEGNVELLDFLEQLDELLENTRPFSSDGPGTSGLVETTLGDFFREFRRLIPSVNLAKSEPDDTRKLLFEGLKDFGYSKEQFLQSLERDIGIHAKKSFSILGASSLLAPKTVRALQLFIQHSRSKTGSNKFIHRLPLPIQAAIPELKEVHKLVSEKDATIRARYDNLLSVSTWQGAIADLTIAYLYASCGLAEDAADTCRQICQNRERSKRYDQYYFEATLLLASILRIQKTSFPKLREARDLLKKIGDINWGDQSVPLPKVRIESERLAGEVNGALVRRYSGHFSGSRETSHERGEFQDLRGRLFAHREQLMGCEDQDSFLVGKLVANVRVNLMLLSEFILADSNKPDLGPCSAYQQVLDSVLERIRNGTQRLSFFEEIVSIFALLRNCDTMILEPNEEIELSARLSNRLGTVLQRREHLNDFEYRIFDFAKTEMRRIGYY